MFVFVAGLPRCAGLPVVEGEVAVLEDDGLGPNRATTTAFLNVAALSTSTS
jgi:hypothetical protein